MYYCFSFKYIFTEYGLMIFFFKHVKIWIHGLLSSIVSIESNRVGLTFCCQRVSLTDTKNVPWNVKVNDIFHIFWIFLVMIPSKVSFAVFLPLLLLWNFNCITFYCAFSSYILYALWCILYIFPSIFPCVLWHWY